VSVGEKAVVADTHESGWKNVEEETPNKFHGAQGHGVFLIAVGVVLPVEADFADLEGLDAVVGDGDPMGVAGEVLEHLLGTAERSLGVHDPLFVAYGLEPALPCPGMGELEELSVKFELLLVESVL